MKISSKAVIPTTFNGISDNHDRLRQQIARMSAVCRITCLGTIKMKIKKWPHRIALFKTEQLLLGRIQNGIGVGVSVNIFWPESESESLEIRRLRSPDCYHPELLLLSYFTAYSYIDFEVNFCTCDSINMKKGSFDR